MTPAVQTPSLTVFTQFHSRGRLISMELVTLLWPLTIPIPVGSFTACVGVGFTKRSNFRCATPDESKNIMLACQKDARGNFTVVGKQDRFFQVMGACLHNCMLNVTTKIYCCVRWIYVLLLVFLHFFCFAIASGLQAMAMAFVVAWSTASFVGSCFACTPKMDGVAISFARWGNSKIRHTTSAAQLPF